MDFGNKVCDGCVVGEEAIGRIRAIGDESGGDHRAPRSAAVIGSSILYDTRQYRVKTKPLD